MHLWSDILRFILSNQGNKVIEGHNIKHNIMTAGVSIVVA